MVENKPLYVLDSCVILKWIFDQEDDAKIALHILDQLVSGEIRVAVPVHSYFEVTNILAIKKFDDILNFISRLLQLGVEEYQYTLALTSKALEIMKKSSGVVYYDAVYHALAMKIGGTFITADENYFKKSSNLKQIIMLRDYKC